MMVNELHSVDSFAADGFAFIWRVVDNASKLSDAPRNQLLLGASLKLSEK
jgi:hypothetical protein